LDASGKRFEGGKRRTSVGLFKSYRLLVSWGGEKLNKTKKVVKEFLNRPVRRNVDRMASSRVITIIAAFVKTESRIITISISRTGSPRPQHWSMQTTYNVAGKKNRKNNAPASKKRKGFPVNPKL